MKKSWFLGSALLLQTVMAATPVYTSMPLISKLTGTTCYYCGDWGWSMMEEIIAKYGANSLVMGSYDSYYQGGNPGESELNNIYSQAWNDAFGGGGFPSFTVNEKLQTVYAGTVADVQGAADAHLAKTQNIGMNFEAWLVGNTVKIARTIQSKSAMTGNYTINTFLIEDSVMHYQSGPVSAVKAHHNVLRAMNSTQAHGDALPAKALSGQPYVDTVTLTIRSETPAWNSKKFKIGLALWNGNTFVNAYTRPAAQTWSSQGGISLSSSSSLSSTTLSSSSSLSSTTLSSSSSVGTQSSSSGNTAVVAAPAHWNVQVSSQGLWVQKTSALQVQTQFSVFDLQGQMVSEFSLGQGSASYLVPLTVPGNYLVQSRSSQGQQSHFYQWHP